MGGLFYYNPAQHSYHNLLMRLGLLLLSRRVFCWDAHSFSSAQDGISACCSPLLDIESSRGSRPGVSICPFLLPRTPSAGKRGGGGEKRQSQKGRACMYLPTRTNLFYLSLLTHNTALPGGCSTMAENRYYSYVGSLYMVACHFHSACFRCPLAV